MNNTLYREVVLDLIQPDPNQPRKIFDELAMEELVASVSKHKVIQPIMIRPKGDIFLIVYGERRWRASKVAGLPDIPCLIRELTDAEALEIQIVENLQRKDIHAMEEAVAFQSLLESGMDMVELTARLGKKEYFVKQRLKLNQLAPAWQTAFFRNAIRMQDALQIAIMPEKLQTDLYRQENGEQKLKEKQDIRISDWTFNQYRGDLSTATFDTADAGLYKKVGACTNCQYNSSSALLFPGEDHNPVCSDISCFVKKTSVAFERNLKAAQDDPAIVLLASDYSLNEAELKSLIKDGKKVYLPREFNEVDELGARPDWNNYCILYPDVTEDERRTEFDKDLAAFEKQQKEFDQAVASGQYLKGLIVAGSRGKGQYLYVRLRPEKGSRKANAVAGVTDSPTAANINQEIRRVEQTERDTRQKDPEKIHNAVVAAVRGHECLKKPGISSKPAEKSLSTFLVYDILPDLVKEKVNKVLGIRDLRPGGDGLQRNFFTKLDGLTDEQVAFIRRLALIERYGKSLPAERGGTAVRLLAEALKDIDVTGIEKAQHAVAADSQRRTAKRVADLNKKKKELQRGGVKKAAKKSKAPKSKK